MGSDSLRLREAVPTQLDQVYQGAIFGQESFEARLQYVGLSDRLRMEERVIGLDIGCWNQFKRADQFIVHILDRGEVGLIGDEPVFFEMMEAGDISQDQPPEFKDDLFRGGCLEMELTGSGQFEEFHYRLGGHAIWVIAFW